jgi:hypothetical protein
MRNIFLILILALSLGSCSFDKKHVDTFEIESNTSSINGEVIMITTVTENYTIKIYNNRIISSASNFRNETEKEIAKAKYFTKQYIKAKNLKLVSVVVR